MAYPGQGYWTNIDNRLFRVFQDGSEEECNYAGINHLAAGKDAPAAMPCVYCGQLIPGTSSTCPGCQAPRMVLITSCRVEIIAVLPDGGRLMDLDARSVLEVRRKNWRFWNDNPYFVRGGVSVRPLRPHYSEAHPDISEGGMRWYDGDAFVHWGNDGPIDKSQYVQHDCRTMCNNPWPDCTMMLRRGTKCPQSGCEFVAPLRGEEKDNVIIRMTEFDLQAMYFDSPVPFRASDGQQLELTMSLECRAEFLFGERR